MGITSTLHHLQWHSSAQLQRASCSEEFLHLKTFGQKLLPFYFWILILHSKFNDSLINFYLINLNEIYSKLKLGHFHLKFILDENDLILHGLTKQLVLVKVK